MQNYGRSLELTESAYNSAGSAMDKYSVYQDSIAAKQERIIALWQEFVQNMNVQEVISDLLSLAEAMMKVFSSELITNILKMIPALVAFGSALKIISAIRGIDTLTGSVSKLDVALKALGGTKGVVLAVASALIALYQVYKMFHKSPEELEENIKGLNSEIDQSSSDLESYKNEMKTTQERIDELLRKKQYGGLSIVEEEELTNLQLENKELENKINLLEEEIKLKEKSREQDAVDLWNSTSKTRNTTDGISVTGVERVSLPQQMEETLSQIQFYEEKIVNETDAEMIEQYQNKLNELRQDALDMYNTMQTMKSGFGEATEEYKQITEASEKYEESLRTTNEEIEEIFSGPTYQGQIDKLTELAEAGELTAEKLNGEEFDGFVSALEQLGFDIDDIINKINEMADETEASMSRVTEATDISRVSALETSVTAVRDALQELNETGYVSHDVVKQLQDGGYDLTGVLELTENGYVTSTEALMGLIEAQRQEYALTMNESLQAAADLVGAKIDEKESYEEVVKAILAKVQAQLAETKATASGYTARAHAALAEGDYKNFSAWNKVAGSYSEEILALQNAESDLNTILANIETNDTAIDYLLNRKSDSYGSGGGSGGSSSTSDVETAYEREIRILEHRQYLAEQWAAVYEGNADTELEYQDKINEQIEIYGELMARVHEEAEKYRQQGYDDESEQIQELQKQYWDYYMERKDLIDGLAEYQKEKEEEMKQAQEDAINELKDAINDLMDIAQDRLDDIVDNFDYQITKLQAMRDLTEAYYDSVNEIGSLQHEIDKDLAKSKSQYAYLDETLRDTIFNEDDYNKLSSKLQGIASECDALYQSYLADLSTLTEDEIYKADQITAEYERQYNYKMMEYQVAQAELNLIRAQTNLQNVMANRNVRMYQNGQWTWVADHEQVANAEEQLEEAKWEYKQSQIDLRQQAVLDQYDSLIASLEGQKAAAENQFEMLQEQWEEIENQLTMQVEGVSDVMEMIKDGNLPQLQGIIDETGASLQSLIASIQAMIGMGGGGGNVLAGANSSGGGGAGWSLGGGGGGNATKGFMEDLTGNPGYSSDDDDFDISGWYNTDIDYSEAYHRAEAAGASDKVLQQIEDLRDQKVEDKYGGKDPNPDWKDDWDDSKKSYDTGGVLNGLGGIKATTKDEVVFSPDISSMLLSPEKSREFLNSADALTKILDNSNGMSKIMTALSGIVTGNTTSYNDSHNIVLNGDIVSKISNDDFNSISSVLKRYIPVMKGV